MTETKMIKNYTNDTELYELFPLLVCQNELPNTI